MKKYKSCLYCQSELSSIWPFCEQCHNRFCHWVPRNMGTYITYHYLVACRLLNENHPGHIIDEIIFNMDSFVEGWGDGNDYLDIAELYYRRGYYAKAVDRYEQSYAWFESTTPDDPEPETVLLLAEIQSKISESLFKLGRDQEAGNKLQTAISQYHLGIDLAQIQAKTNIMRAPLYASACFDIAELYRKTGQADSAIGWYYKARAIFYIAARIDKRFYSQLLSTDEILVGLIQKRTSPNNTTTACLIKRLNKEIENIQNNICNP